MGETQTPFRALRFVTSAHRLDQLPGDARVEIALAGRSNAGKSSTLNALAQNKTLARVARQPGRTQAINVYALAPGRYLTDLPGYGYAAVPKALRDRWDRLLNAYLRRRQALRALVVIMDCRHPLRETDRQLLGWAQGAGLETRVLLNKCDKLGRGALAKQVRQVGEALDALGIRTEPIAYSALSGANLEAVRAALWALLAAEPAPED